MLLNSGEVRPFAADLPVLVGEIKNCLCRLNHALMEILEALKFAHELQPRVDDSDFQNDIESMASRTNSHCAHIGKLSDDIELIPVFPVITDGELL